MSGMRLAAYLAMVLALILGSWTAIDYHQNERQKQLVVLELEATIVAPHSGMGGRVHQDLNEVLAGESRDGKIGITAVLVLIGSVLLFKKSNQPIA